MSNLNPQQFVYHGTARPIEGNQIVPAKVHGKGSYWGDTGSGRGEPSEEHAWAHPDESKTWEFALDRANFHIMDGAEKGEEHPIAPRARVYALHPNEHMSGGGDASIPGEIKAPHFDIAHPIDTIPGHQGTFPEVNWNEHVKQNEYLPGDEDANHPSDLSIQFGHSLGVWGDEESAHSKIRKAAQDEGVNRWLERVDAVSGTKRFGPPPKEEPLPGMHRDSRAIRRLR